MIVNSLLFHSVVVESLLDSQGQMYGPNQNVYDF